MSPLQGRRCSQDSLFALNSRNSHTEVVAGKLFTSYHTILLEQHDIAASHNSLRLLLAVIAVKCAAGPCSAELNV